MNFGANTPSHTPAKDGPFCAVDPFEAGFMACGRGAERGMLPNGFNNLKIVRDIRGCGSCRLFATPLRLAFFEESGQPFLEVGGGAGMGAGFNGQLGFAVERFLGKLE